MKKHISTVNRRMFLKSGLAVAGLACLSGKSIADPAPNIIVVLLDDMGYSDFGCYGGEARTPNIDSLAANGIRFRNFYNTARCSPTRAAILTGNYSQQVSDVPGDSLPDLRTDNNITTAELLRGQGYRTYMAGKWHLGTDTPEKPWHRGFEHVYGFGPGGASSGADYWDSTDYKLTSTNNEITPIVYGTNAYEFYQTDAIVDYGIEFIDHNIGKGDGAPFFIYLPFHAPHFDLCAPASTAEYTPTGGVSYLNTYTQGWDVVRQDRYDRMLAMGAIDSSYVLPPFSDTPFNTDGAIVPVPAWNTLDADRKADLARRMAIYTAMIDRIDVAVGRLIEHLTQTGLLDNTLIFILSDNGSNSEGGVHGSSDTYGKDPLTGSDLENMGQPFAGDGIRLGGGWANVGNTPFRYYKRFNHEGGIHTPLIVHWPAGITNAGRWSDQLGHVIDVMSTIADVSGVTFPTQYNGHAVVPMEGESLVPVFNDEAEFSRQLGFEHEANRGWIDGHWKLVTKNFTSTDWSSFADTLELYDLQADPTELNNVAMDEPDRLVSMIEAWNSWAQRVGVPSGRLLILPKLSGPAAGGEDLLLDTFNRNDLADIDAQTSGMSGSLAPSADAVYYEGYESSGTPDSIRVFGEALQMAFGGGTAENGLMYNFTNQAITDAGGFVIDMDVTAINGAASANNYAGIAVGLTAAQASADDGSNSFRGAAHQVTDAVDSSGGWTLAGGTGSLDVKDMSPTAGDSYFNFNMSPGSTAPYNNRAAVKNLGVTLQAGATYTITGDINQSHTNYPFIGDAFSTATSEQVAFGFFVTNGIDFSLASNAERQKIRNAINAILLDADSAGGLTWTARIIPNGTSGWQTWSYTFTVATNSPYAGQPVWFGVYGGHTDSGSGHRSFAFDNLGLDSPSFPVSDNQGADFFTDLDGAGNVNVWSRGNLLETVPVGVTTGRLAAAFAMDSFALNSTVRAGVYFNGEPLDINTADAGSRTRTFSWGHDHSNYIGLSARADAGVEVDNLAIRTFPIGRILAGGYAEQFGLSGDDAGPDADPDGDGRSNYQEWAIGSDPSVADEDTRAISLISVPVQDGNVRFAIRRLSDPSGAGIAYTFHVSVDLLQAWTEIFPEEIEITPAPEPGYEQVELQLPPEYSDEDHLFLLVRYVEQGL